MKTGKFLDSFHMQKETRVNSSWDGLPLLIFGTSGISKEVKAIIDEINSKNYTNMYKFLGFVSESEEEVGLSVANSQVVCSDDSFKVYIRQFRTIGIVIPIGTPAIKKKIYEKICGYDNLIYPNIISPSAQIMDYASVKIGMGNIICSGCILTTEICIGNFNLINLNSTVGHNVILGDYGVINPLSSISGGVEIGNNVLLGAGSAIKQGLKIGADSIVGLGAIITKNVEAGTVMICQAAHVKEIKNE